MWKQMAHCRANFGWLISETWYANKDVIETPTSLYVTQYVIIFSHIVHFQSNEWIVMGGGYFSVMIWLESLFNYLDGFGTKRYVQLFLESYAGYILLDVRQLYYDWLVNRLLFSFNSILYLVIFKKMLIFIWFLQLISNFFIF